ncbi:methyltransferase [Actinokineospora guangxiensis]|uniref:Methyltransferase n=1 Tax=Actinokineospora guangxiensis TaxID=1490288 RepID=A0ABW0EGZ8_9PSEU
MTPTTLERAVFGIFSTHSLHLAAKHGLFAALVARPDRTPAELAIDLGVDEATLERLVLVLTSTGVLSQSGGRVRVTDDAVPYVDPESPRCLLGFVEHLVADTAERMGHLDDYLRKGKAAVDAGLPAPFEVIYRDEESTRRFVTAMWQLSFHVSDELARLAELGDARRLVDVGGANGPFSAAALGVYPRLRSTVFDLPAVAPHLAETARAHGLGERLCFQAGDFFADPLPEGDCVAFGYILSDWDDETCAMLLRKAYDALPPGGRVLVMDRLFDADRSGPQATAVMNLSMYFETEGRHRTEAELTGLLRRAGFDGCSVRRSSADKHLVLGTRGARR